MLYPLAFLGSFFEALGMILEKKILFQKRFNYKNYTTYGFFALFVFMLTFIWRFWTVRDGALSPYNLLLFGGVILISLFANFSLFYSLKRKNISEFESLWLLSPLFTVLLAILIYPGERQWMIAGLALISSIALLISHIQKHHLQLDRYIFAGIASSFLFSLELVLSKQLLDYYSGFTLYFIRCFFILLVCFLLFRPSFSKVGSTNWIIIFTIAASWVFHRGIVYYGYTVLGVVYTTLIMILSPVLLLLMAVIFLGEKPTLRQIISMAVIFSCVIISLFV